jgi:hypothetical protein
MSLNDKIRQEVIEGREDPDEILIAAASTTARAEESAATEKQSKTTADDAVAVEDVKDPGGEKEERVLVDESKELDKGEEDEADTGVRCEPFDLSLPDLAVSDENVIRPSDPGKSVELKPEALFGLKKIWSEVIGRLSVGRPVLFAAPDSGVPYAYTARFPDKVAAPFFYKGGNLDVSKLKPQGVQFAVFDSPECYKRAVDAGYMVVAVSARGKYVANNIRSMLKQRPGETRTSYSMRIDSRIAASNMQIQAISKLVKEKVIQGFVHKPCGLMDALFSIEAKRHAAKGGSQQEKGKEQVPLESADPIEPEDRDV